MYKIIGADQKEYGPSSADEIRQWVAEGRANGQTLVQIEGSGEWRPLASYQEFSGLIYHQPPPAASPEQMRRMKENDVTELTDGANRDFDFTASFRRSLRLLKNNFGLLAGAATLIWLIDNSFSFVPILGPLMHWLLSGILMGGLYRLYLKCIRGEEVSLGDAFSGFTTSPTQLMLAGLVAMLLTEIGFVCCFIIPGIYLMVGWTFSVPLVADKNLEFWSAMESSRKVVTQRWLKVCGLLFLAFLPFALYSLYNMYASFQGAYTAFHSLQNSPIDLKKISEFFDSQVAKEAAVRGFISRVILLLNYPFALGTMLYAYEDLFGSRKAPTA